MKKLSNGIWVYLSILVFLCVSCVKTTDTTLTDFRFNGTQVNSLEELWGIQPETVALETSSDCLVGKISKIIGKNGKYFILSDDRHIYVFGKDGKHLSTLSCLGNGPGEYSFIGDFNVQTASDDTEEIWLCDTKKIHIYRFKEHWEYTQSISYDFVINKFHIISSDRILVLCGRQEKTLAITDYNGNVIDSYLDYQIPFLTFYSVQFIPYDSLMLFRLGMSNACAVYDLSTGKFGTMVLSPEKKLLTDKQLVDLFERYEYNYLREIASYSYIRTIGKYKGTTCIEYYSDGNRYLSATNEDGEWKHLKISLVDERNSYQLTLGTSISDEESIILYGYSGDDNPVLYIY